MSSPTVKFTPTQVRDREVAHLNIKGLPTPWWTEPAGNDCIAFQMWVLGLRAPDDYELHWISISAFRKWANWIEVAPASIKAGDLVLENWGGTTDANGELIAEHMEYCYAIDRAAGTITTIAANTGPQPGRLVPRGVYKKTRALSDHFIKGIRIPYTDEKASKARIAEVKAVAAYLNKLHLGRTSAAADDGIEGENYWWLVQTWGRYNGAYPSGCVIDGIPGPHTRGVEKVLAHLAGHR